MGRRLRARSRSLMIFGLGEEMAIVGVLGLDLLLPLRLLAATGDEADEVVAGRPEELPDLIRVVHTPHLEEEVFPHEV